MDSTLAKYSMATLVLIGVLPVLRPKAFRRYRKYYILLAVLTILLLAVFLGFDVPLGLGKEDLSISNFYSCDNSGDPQYYFPRKTIAYFNISIENLALDPKNVSIYLTVQDVLNVPVGSDQLYTTIPQNVSTHYTMSVFLPKWAYVGLATAYASLKVEGLSVDSNSTEFYIGPEDLTPPIVHILSPENVTYDSAPFSLVFTVNERTTWIGYALDNLENVTIRGNVTLPDLDNGSHKILVYANDTSSNTGSSQEVRFTVSIIHDVAVVNLTYYPTDVYVGQVVNITVLVENQGTMKETFNVTVYADINIVETLTVNNLTRSKQEVLVFMWNTTDSAKGTYTITAYVPPVPREDDILDNTWVGGTVNIKLRPDIATTSVTTSRTWIGQGCSALISVTVINQGDKTESFNVTIYANTIIITTIENITLATSSSKTMNCTWNTTGFAFGNYTISAYAWPLTDELDTSDNNFIGGWVVVSILGDVVGPPDTTGPPDGKVDMRDIDVILSRFGATPRYLNWDLNFDINEDGVINMRDINIACSNFGKHYP